MVQTRSTTATVSTPSVGPGASHHIPTDSQTGATTAQEEETRYNTPSSQATTTVPDQLAGSDLPRSALRSDDDEGEQAKEFGKWRDGTGISQAHWGNIFNSNGVGAGSFDHLEVEEPDWTPEDFEKFDRTNDLRETIKDVKTARKSEVSVCGPHSGFQLTVTGDARAGAEDIFIDDSERLYPQEPSVAGHSPYGSFEGNPQSAIMSITRPTSDVAMEDAETASRAASEETDDDTADLAASQDPMGEEKIVGNKDKLQEPAHDEIPIQAGVEPSETSSTAYNLASLGDSIATTSEGQSSTAGDSSSMPARRKGLERSYMPISYREITNLAPDSETLHVRGKGVRKGERLKYTG